MRVLVVEDERRLAENVARSLRESAGYAVDIAYDGEEGLFMAGSSPYDLIVLDLMLPKMDGKTVLHKIRLSGSGVPVLVLTARDEKESIVALLNAGADDYVAKPFDLGELMARVKAVLRRARPQLSTETLSYKDLSMDLATHRVKRMEKDVHLGPTEFRLLRFLMENQGRVFSREQLLDHVWGRDIYVEPRTVDVHIRRLRKAINIEGAADVIRTVRAAGYSLDVEG